MLPRTIVCNCTTVIVASGKTNTLARVFFRKFMKRLYFLFKCYGTVFNAHARTIESIQGYMRETVEQKAEVSVLKECSLVSWRENLLTGGLGFFFFFTGQKPQKKKSLGIASYS